MPTIEQASIPVTEFPNQFASPFGNDGVVPLYSSVPLRSPVSGCLPCVVCGNSSVRNQAVSSLAPSRVSIASITPQEWWYTNATGDQQWENVLNWNSRADGAGVNPTEIPWTSTDGSTDRSNLHDASGGAGVYITSVSLDPNRVIRAVCSIPAISFFSYSPNFSDTAIYGGIFTGDNFYNNGIGFDNILAGVQGGTFLGNNFYNGGTINGGTFMGGNFTNAAYSMFDHPAGIFEGSFYGSDFVNLGGIYGGDFYGDNFSNQATASGIDGGNFYGENFMNDGRIGNGNFQGVNFTCGDNASIGNGTFVYENMYNVSSGGGVFTANSFGDGIYGCSNSTINAFGQALTAQGVSLTSVIHCDSLTVLENCVVGGGFYDQGTFLYANDLINYGIAGGSPQYWNYNTITFSGNNLRNYGLMRVHMTNQEIVAGSEIIQYEGATLQSAGVAYVTDNFQNQGGELSSLHIIANSLTNDGNIYSGNFEIVNTFTNNGGVGFAVVTSNDYVNNGEINLGSTTCQTFTNTATLYQQTITAVSFSNTGVLYGFPFRGIGHCYGSLFDNYGTLQANRYYTFGLAGYYFYNEVFVNHASGEIHYEDWGSTFDDATPPPAWFGGGFENYGYVCGSNWPVQTC